MRVDQLSGLIALLKVAETRSFRRAAAELGVAPPSVSEAVKGLESRLGVRLLNRTTRSVGLTEAGTAYLDRVRPAAEEILAAGRMLKEAASRPAGTLRLSLPWIAGPLFVEPLIAPFMRAYPDISVDIVFDDRFADVVRDGFDAGVRIGELLETDMVAVRASGPLPMAVLASPAYLEARGMPQVPQDLAGHSCITYRFASTGAVAAWEFVDEGRTAAFTPQPRLSVNALSLAVAAAAEGVGLAFAMEALAADALRAKRLVKVLERFCPIYEPLYLYCPSRRLMPPKLRALVDFVRRHASD